MIQQQPVVIAALSTTSEPIILPPGAKVVRVKSPVMSVATSFGINGSVDDTTYDTLYQGSSNTSLSFTVGGTARSINIPPEYTAGLKRVQIKTNGAETTDKTFNVVYEW